MIEIEQPEPPMITLSSPADLLSAVPYLLGYAPSNSLVLIGLSDKDIRISACIPLPGSTTDLHRLPIPTQSLERTEVLDAILIGYGPAEKVTASIDHVLKVLNERDIEIVEALRVTDGRWWSYICEEPSCCPAEGTRFAPETSSVPATMMFHGLQAFDSREEVTRQLAPVQGAVRRTVEAETSRLLEHVRSEPGRNQQVVTRTEAKAIMDEALTADRLPGPADTVRLAVAMCESRIRATALMAVDERGSAGCVRLWLWVVRHVDPPLRSRAAAVLGYAAWRDGQGALAAEAVRLCLADSPTDRLGSIVERLLDAGVAPCALPKLGHIDFCD